MPKYISCTIFNSELEVLIFKHLHLDKWSIPVGCMDDGESYSDTLVRVMQAELGIAPTYFQAVTDTHPIGGGFDHHVRHFVLMDYTGAIINKEPGKHTDLQYLSRTKIRDLEINKSTQTLLDNWDLYITVNNGVNLNKI